MDFKALGLKAENTTELIIDQIQGALKFPWQIIIMKCLKLSGIVSPPYMILESMYAVLTICNLH